jgi:hypothetical protein
LVPVCNLWKANERNKPAKMQKMSHKCL